MSQQEIPLLLERYLKQEATDAEKVALAEWIGSSPEEEKLTLLENAWNAFDIREPMHEEHMQVILDNILREPAVGKVPQEPAVEKDPLDPTIGNVPPEPTVRKISVYRRLWARVAVAAVVILLAGAGYLFRKAGDHRSHSQPAAAIENKADIAPGGNKAILTLGNGTKIMLDSAANGLLAQQGSSSISKLSDGSLAYQAVKTTSGSGQTTAQGVHQAPGANQSPGINQAAALTYNTLSTPRGGQYRLVLPDGTIVWLNAASSITYPAAFAGSHRKVTVTGEVYFEIAPDKQMPFEVEAGPLSIDVLGTHFNINAYPDETVTKTTVLEGSIRLRNNKASEVLHPGQQGQAEAAGTIRTLQEADLDQVMAWKNGLFYFKHADIPTVMRQISRWYDVDVEYQGAVPARDFRGKIQRDLQLSQVLRFLEQLDVHFTIEGKKIIVRP